ncbi:MAG TPA: peptide-methionine (S)-S-oxide reductase MsrA [Candidatus Dormibacteraeota bacterium]|jgi:peptide-methionine (S)-S-oxide reductase|nr:peptide-methionine (S)-S-oxide reductase MsrA [Candidatus Dormibacteraeota bacterium]
MQNNTETATLAGGCFWCLDAAYRQIDGVKGVVSGYAGGERPNPTYEEVCTGRTGHAEAVQVEFDPGVITYPEILDILWTIHDPTTLNRQGADVGTQYRSAIFYHDDTQKAAAEASRDKVQELWPNPVVTEIVPLEAFYPAEAYHQDYYAHNPNAGYCQVVINPKLKKLREHHAARIKARA